MQVVHLLPLLLLLRESPFWRWLVLASRCLRLGLLLKL
jgi:hypothetical protein